MLLDEYEMETLKENYDEEMINQLDEENANIIVEYLEDNGIYFATDLIISYLELFLMDSNVFIERFEKVKEHLGEDFVEKLEDSLDALDIMYQD